MSKLEIKHVEDQYGHLDDQIQQIVDSILEKNDLDYLLHADARDRVL